VNLSGEPVRTSGAVPEISWRSQRWMVWLRSKTGRWSLVCVLGLTLYCFSLPKLLFTDPYSTVLQDRQGELLSAGIAPDGQWRFPETHEVPDKFAQALITYEDRRFHRHIGVDVLALLRAVRQDIQARAVVSGGSTLSMQVIRMSRKGKSRTAWEKLLEIILATRLEWRYSKEEILALYASHAPFGGNVVGLDAACWRYFGRPSSQLSWGEAALLAVLPNAPAMMHPRSPETKERSAARAASGIGNHRRRDAEIIGCRVYSGSTPAAAAIGPPPAGACRRGGA
jgi:membrane carboxypeptidase/penicillin-binding protein PbpC